MLLLFLLLFIFLPFVCWLLLMCRTDSAAARRPAQTAPTSHTQAAECCGSCSVSYCSFPFICHCCAGCVLCAGLTALQLGGLPARFSFTTLKLPSLRCLTTHIKPALQAVPNNPQPDSLQSLAAFPGLTRLELTGMIGAAALQQLPSVAAPQLRELLLPQRLWRVGWSDLAALQVGGLGALCTCVVAGCSYCLLAVCL
jgi:hypothetical protein